MVFQESVAQTGIKKIKYLIDIVEKISQDIKGKKVGRCYYLMLWGEKNLNTICHYLYNGENLTGYLNFIFTLPYTWQVFYNEPVYSL